ncbi:MAG TPA: WecB/TagA/CpsF family glycosyltransferase, partial [Candidatus Ozemobacteraceae bacterium]|nr:WecB/TagA/CpsF family glycosyltransferase [Candidatus Ozemobacteraceae bacterium]
MDLSTTTLALALGLLGTLTGWLIPIMWDAFQGDDPWSLQRATRHLGRGRYIGGLPVVLGAFFILLMPHLPGEPESQGLAFLTAVYATLGFIHDTTRASWTVMLPYLLLAGIAGAWNGITIDEPSRILEILFTLAWPIITILSLKIAALVFGMPALLCLGSGLTFLLFFPGQAATPPAAVSFTLLLMLTPLLVLVGAMTGRRFILGDSGHFALGWLLAGISMIGRSKTLLLFGLLLPSAVVVLPLVFVCLVILASYLGNELYETDPARRRRTFSWNLPRQRLVVSAGLVFLSLNFAILLYTSQAGLWGFIALGILIIGVMASFVQAFAQRVPAEDTASHLKGTPQNDTFATEDDETTHRIQLFGIPIDSLSRVRVLDRIDGWLRSGDAFHHLVTADSLAIERSRHDKSFARTLQQASLVMPDGAGLVWAADFLGMPLLERIPGVSLVEDLCKLAASAKQSVFFVGAKPGTIDSAVQLIGKRVPGLLVAGTHHGYFAADSETETHVIRLILEAKPRLLFVAMGVPRQEQFIAKLRPVASGMTAIGVGGSFDVIYNTDSVVLTHY